MAGSNRLELLEREAVAPEVAATLATELGRKEAWADSQVEAFRPVGLSFLVS